MAFRRARHEDLENALNRGALWAVTYGDMMSYLMIFFLILYSFTIAKGKLGEGQKEKLEEAIDTIQTVFGGKADAKAKERREARKKEDQAVKDLTQEVQSGDVEIKVTQGRVRMDLKDRVLFDSGKADLKFEAKRILHDIAERLKGLPNPIIVEGHTDNVPIRHGRYTSNWELSMARAYAVIRFLESEGIQPNRLSGSGYGEHRPVADNAAPDGRAKNRRIGIEYIRTD